MKLMVIWPSLPTATKRTPISSKLVSYIANLLPLSSWFKSIMSTLMSDILSIVITSVLLTDSPGLIPSAGARMNGSSIVPAPEMNSGSDVVFSGSGPSASINRILSLCMTIGITSKSSSRKTRQKHHPQLHSNKLSGSALFFRQLPSESVSATSVASSGSVPQSSSAISDAPSPSSSKSSINPVVELPVIVSGFPSPSVSRCADASVGNASGPAVQLE